MKKGDLLKIGKHIAIATKIDADENLVYFVYLNRHVPGTAKHEVWSIGMKSVKMNIVSSA
jgi:hypothetical protein